VTAADRATFYAGVDIGGTNMQVAVVDAGMQILARNHVHTDVEGGFEGVVEQICSQVRDACRQACTTPDQLRAIGIAAAGAMDVTNGLVLEAPNLHWKNAPLSEAVTSRVRRPVVLENDVNAALLAEHRLGAGLSYTDLLGVWVGTGLGGGLVLNDRLYRGWFQTAGEIGHMVVDHAGPEHARTYEHLCSRSGMLRQIGVLAMQEGKNSPLHAIDGMHALADAYRTGNASVRSIVHHGATLLGEGIANLVTLLSLQGVVLGGGVVEVLGDEFLTPMRRAFHETVFPDRCRGCALLPTTLRGDAGLIGAAIAARDQSDS
jgi:glucokinase